MKKFIETLELAKRKQKENFDTLIAIVGRERVGKSTLMLHGIDYLGGGIEDIALDRARFVGALTKVKDEGNVVLDEAGDTLFSRDAMDSFNKDMVKAYTVIGGKRLITFLVLPNFFILDRYFREHRVRVLFYVHRRGRFFRYGPKEIKKMILAGDRFIPFKGVTYTDSFPDYKGPLLAPYLELKKAKINDSIKMLGNKYNDTGAPRISKIDWIKESLHRNLPVGIIAKTADVTQQYIYRIRKELSTKQTALL